jgi:hypothetical protein
MIQKLSRNDHTALWINTDHILTMETIENPGFATTQIYYVNGGRELVRESPADIMININRWLTKP